MEVVVLAVVSIVAAVLVLIAAHRWRTARRKLAFTVEALPPGAAPGETTHARISAKNIGRGRISVATLGLEFPGAGLLAKSGAPVRLAPGEETQAVVDLWEVSARLWEVGARTECLLYGLCTDSAGRIYRGDVWSFMPRHPSVHPHFVARGAEASRSRSGAA